MCIETAQICFHPKFLSSYCANMVYRTTTVSPTKGTKLALVVPCCIFVPTKKKKTEENMEISSSKKK